MTKLGLNFVRYLRLSLFISFYPFHQILQKFLPMLGRSKFILRLSLFLLKSFWFPMFRVFRFLFMRLCEISFVFKIHILWLINFWWICSFIFGCCLLSFNNYIVIPLILFKYFLLFFIVYLSLHFADNFWYKLFLLNSVILLNLKVFNRSVLENLLEGLND